MERISSEDEYIRIMMRMMDVMRKKDELQKIMNYIEKRNNTNITLEGGGGLEEIIQMINIYIREYKI